MEDGGGKGGEDVYKGKAEPMLVLLSDLYSENDNILVCDSRPSSCPAYTLTDYFYDLKPLELGKRTTLCIE